MFSQHPDHAGIPFWHSQALIKTHHELKECYLLLSEFGGEEMMWDWEGKLVDDSVVERLISNYHTFFTEKQIGSDVFITFRVPNPRIESGYRLGRAFMVIMQAHDLTESVGFKKQPLFEVILPMTESATEMIVLRESYKRIAEATHTSFGSAIKNKETLEVIPIFESVPVILKSRHILDEYLTLSEEIFKEKITYLRPFLARSDPALNSGIVATTMSLKWALSEFQKLSKVRGISVFPIIAPGALPFRGGLTPDTVDDFLTEFSGIATLVIQSAFRYDYDKTAVTQAISSINEKIWLSKSTFIPQDAFPYFLQIISMFELPYKETVERLAPLITKMSHYVPKRRERVQHIGLFGYSRHVGGVSLPRAIGFTASCYSLGLPPEFFGLGKALKNAKVNGYLPMVEEYYPGLKKTLKRAGKYVRKKSFKELHQLDMESEMAIVEEYIGEDVGPQTASEKEHERLVGEIIKTLVKGESPHDLIEQAAVLRKSIG